MPATERPPEVQALIASRSNQIHAKLDYVWGAGAYTSGTLMQAAGQGSALVFFSMWATGTYFFVTAQMREIHGPSTDTWTNEAAASWMWMLCCFRQFKMHGRLKWAGYSSWSGLMLTTYYSVRAVFARMTA